MDRRNFLKIAAAAGAAGTLAGCLGNNGGNGTGSAAASLPSGFPAPPSTGVQPTGRVRPFSLFLHRMQHTAYPGASMPMWGFSLSDDPSSGRMPGPVLRVTEGDEVVVNFRSLIGGEFPHTIHWHGVHVDWRNDGVPYVTQDPIQPDEEFEYRFIAKPSGTFWYHCHFDVQHHLDMGMYGAIIIDPQDPEADLPYDRDVVLFLDEMDRYHLESGQSNTGNEPQSGDPFDYEEYARRQTQDTVNRNTVVSENNPAKQERDWYPVTLDPYSADYNTFLLNGHSFPNTEPILISEGEIIRMRFINAGGQVHAMHLHGHHMLVTHKDGVRLPNPYWADTVPVAPGERYDVYVVGDNPGIWDFHDHTPSTNQNDKIWPGGMMTLFVYEEFLDQVNIGHGGHGGAGMRSGDLLGLYK